MNLTLPSINRMDKPIQNSDGTTDMYFGPTLPQRAPEKNWLRTLPGQGWFTLFRLCGPKKEFLDQSWSRATSNESSKPESTEL
jgi:hypothetical protein